MLILGARSDIAMAAAHRFARDGWDILLAARNVDSLDVDRSDIELRYQAAVTLFEFDGLDIGSHTNFAGAFLELPTIVICAIGVMGEQAKSEQDVFAAANVMRSNFEGPASILSVFANHFEERGSGTLIGISSVAGERGRATNYVYGSAKAGFSAFLSGLRNRLAPKGVHVVTVLPGFVATKMTDGMNLPSKLTAQAEEVAQTIFNAVRKRRDVVYVKPIWFPIMMVIRNIPERLFKNMRL